MNTNTATSPLTLADRKALAATFYEAYKRGELDTSMALEVLERKPMLHPTTGEVCIVDYAHVEHWWVWVSLITVDPVTGDEFTQGEHLLGE